MLSSPAAFADISGRVFRDFNANGTFNAALNEQGVAGVSVKAFDSTGSNIATATTAANGTYTLTLAAGTDYRVEFTWAETWLKPGVAGGTSVQFVQNGANGVNLALNNPAQTIAPSASPSVVTAVQSGSVHFGSEFVLTKIPASAGTNASAGMSAYMTPAPTVLAKETEMGAIWGVAHDRVHQRLLAGAFVKRFARLAGNPTTIYSVAEDGSGTPSAWVTLDSTRTDPHGATPAWARDFAVIPSIGKDGLGDVDIAEDGSAVYTIDMKTKEFVRIPVNADGSAGTPVKVTLPTTLANCTNSNDVRPMGLGVRDGKVYIGAVCSAESTVTGLPIANNTARKGDASKLRGYVLQWDGASAFTSVIDFPLNYTRGCLNEGGMGTCSSYGNAAWQAWTPTYPFSDFAGLDASGYPQPMISDIDFTADGSMVLGLADRFGHMDGAYALEPPSGAFSSGQLTAVGDILRACKKSDGTFVMEKQISGDASCSSGGKGMDANKARTLDEWYFEDDMGAAAPGNHADVGEGGIGLLLGTDTVISTAMDPAQNALGSDPSTGADPWESHGLHWYDGITGGWSKGYALVDQAQTNDVPAWGKGNGLGDVEVLYPPAPIEIGNRVWLDSDADGVQDAGEKGLSGITVELKSGATLLASATTDANGNYYFSNATGTDTTSKKYNLSALQPNTAYTVHFPLTVTDAGTTYNLTTTKAGIDTLIDSDAATTGDVSIAAADIPVAGANNHTFDVGYSSAPATCTTIANTASVTKVTETDNNTANDSASATIQANCTTPKTDLKLVKTVDKTTARKGDTLTYTLTVTNESDIDATNVTVTDNLPTTLTYVSHTPSGVNYNQNTGVWNVGTVPAKQSTALVIKATVN